MAEVQTKALFTCTEAGYDASIIHHGAFIAKTGCRHFSTALRKKQIWFLWGK